MQRAGPGACFIFSRHFRRAMEDYDLLPTEIRLLHRLCLETFDSGVLGGWVDLPAWAVKLRMRDAKGLRVDKCEKVFLGVVALGIVDHNSGQGTYQLRPDPLSWSRVRALYGAEKAEQELKLCADRPLSDSLSELSRENALRGVPEAERDWHALFTGLRAALQAGPDALDAFSRAHPEIFSAEKSADVRQNPPIASAEKSAEYRRKNPPTKNPQCLQPVASRAPLSAEKSAETASLALASLASPVPKLASLEESKVELAKASLSAEKSAELVNRAKQWVKSIDRMGQLEDPTYGPQWVRLCEEYPNYVLTRLRRRFDLYERNASKEEDRLLDPLAYLSQKARYERKMRNV